MIPWRGDRLPTPEFLGFPGVLDHKESAMMWETWVWSLGWEDPLENGTPTHSSFILAWRIPWTVIHHHLSFPGGSDGKESACNAGDSNSIPGWGRSPEKEMATHSSVVAWRIPWTEKPGGLQSMGSQRVGHDWATNTFTFIHSLKISGIFWTKKQFQRGWVSSLRQKQSLDDVKADWTLSIASASSTPWTAFRQVIYFKTWFKVAEQSWPLPIEKRIQGSGRLFSQPLTTRCPQFGLSPFQRVLIFVSMCAWACMNVYAGYFWDRMKALEISTALWTELCPPSPKYVGVLSLSTAECGLIGSWTEVIRLKRGWP